LGVQSTKGETTMKKNHLARWLLVFAVLAALIAGCAPPGPQKPQGTNLPSIPNAVQQPPSLR
jgi:hypothetical protein